MLTGHSETQVCSRRTDIMAQLSCCGRYQLCARVSSRLYFLKISQHSLLSTDDLLYFYMSAVRPLLECAYPEWQTSLTKEQSGQIESIQKQAFRIIFNNNCIDYAIFAEYTNCRHWQIVVVSCRTFLRNTFYMRKAACTIYFHPPPCIDEHRILQHENKFQPPRARTTRYNKSVVLYALNNNQSNSL